MRQKVNTTVLVYVTFIVIIFFLKGYCSEGKIIGFNYFPVVQNPYPILQKEVSQIKDRVFLCTRPRTGTNLVSGILSALTRAPVFWSKYLFCGEKHLERGTYLNRFKLNIKDNGNAIMGMHSPELLGYFFKTESKIVTQNYLVITLRNYKESIYRKSSEEKPLTRDEILECCEYNGQEVYDLLSIYDAWDESRRFIIRYESLISNPLEVIDDLALFLKARRECLLDVKKNFESYKKRAMKSYKIHPGGQRSDGMEAVIHSRNVKASDLEEIDYVMRNLNPRLYDKYLKEHYSHSV